MTRQFWTEGFGTTLPALETWRVQNSDPTTDQNFGEDQIALARDGSMIVVGVSGYDAGATVDAGAVFVFDYNPSTDLFDQTAHLVPDEINTNGHFGRRVAVSEDGNTIAVSMESHSSAVGIDPRCAAFIFARKEKGAPWTQQLYVDGGLVPNPQFSHFDGLALSYDGNVFALGDAGATVDGGHLGWGDVTVYKRSAAGAWTVDQDLPFPSGMDNDRANNGASLALSWDGKTLAVGGPATTVGKFGRVNVWIRGALGWTQETLAPLTNTLDDQLGGSVSLSLDGNVLIAGAVFGPTGASGGGPNPGRAWVYRRTAGVWSAGVGIAPFDAFDGERFGQSVAMAATGLRCIVGELHGGAVPPLHYAHVFTWAPLLVVPRWIDTEHLTIPAALNSLGATVAINASGDVCAAGAPYEDVPLTDAGAAYLFETA